MRNAWRAWSLFGAGALFGLLAGAVLYAPPELANQPPPWARSAADHGSAVAAPRVAAVPTPQAPVAAPGQAASAPPAGGVAASEPLTPVQAAGAASLPQGEASPAPSGPAIATAPIAPAPQVAAPAQRPVKEVTARAPAPRKHKAPSESTAVDTTTSGAGPASFAASPAQDALRVEPESVRAQAPEVAPARNDADSADASR